MAKTRNVEKVAIWRKGDAIAAKRLDRMGRAINANTDYLAGPKELNALDDTEEATEPPPGLTDLVFTESGRTTTEVEVTDSNGDTHDITQIDQVTLTNATGDILILNFTNP